MSKEESARITRQLYQTGNGPYFGYRIPTLITLPTGRIIAFAEARRASLDDHGTIDIVARISDDGGASFGPVSLVARYGENTLNNPSPVYDRDTGMLWLLLNCRSLSSSSVVVSSAWSSRRSTMNLVCQ